MNCPYRLVRMALFVGVLLMPMSGTQPQSVTVNIKWNITHQTLDGFGVSQTAGDPSDPFDPAGFAHTLNHWPQKNEIMDLAFSQTKGIGLTILRSKIRPNLKATPGGAWNDTDADQVQLMKDAVQRGPVKLIGTVWSPPAWMKKDGRTSSGTCQGNGKACRYNEECGCTAIPASEDNCEFQGKRCQEGTSYLDPNFYQSFANYLSHYASEYASRNGVNIYAVSMANEPDSRQKWDSCTWTSSQIATFLGSYLGPTFAANGVTAKVIAPETVSWPVAEDRLTKTYATPAARARLDIQASHLYGGNPTKPFYSAEHYNKKSWVTEVSGKITDNHAVWDMDGALQWATTIHESLVTARVNAWLWWNLALWKNDESLISLNTDSNGLKSYLVSKTFWVLGHFSKFIRPGFVRLETGATPGGVLVSAYRDPVNDQFVLVAINHRYGPAIIKFNVQGFATHEVTPYVTGRPDTLNLIQQPATTLVDAQTIPPRSIVTYVSRTRNFNLWASAPNARAIAGDFNGDGRSDIALVGGDGWSTVPVAFSLGNGTFSITNVPITNFAFWANNPDVKIVAGDINRDGRDDLIATGGAGWTTIPVARSNGDGSFTTLNLTSSEIPIWAQAPGVKVVAGDVNNDGRDDLILTGGSDWHTIPVGLSVGDGTFTVTNFSVSSFPTYAQNPYAQASATDINGDGRADIVLTSGAGWTRIPIALSVGSGTTFSGFTPLAKTNPDISVWSQAPGAKLLTGCRRTVPLADQPNWHHCNINGGVGGDLYGDIILIGGPDWWTIPVGFSDGNGMFNVTNVAQATFAAWAQDPAAKAVSGDFDGNGRADIALVGGNQWWTVPIAFSFGNGHFSVTNFPIN